MTYNSAVCFHFDMPRKAQKNRGTETLSQPELIQQPTPDKPDDPGYQVNGAEGKSTESVSIRLTDDGQALPSTRQASWDKLKAMVDKTPGARERLLGTAAASGGLIEAKQIEPFYSGIGLINTFLAIRILKMETAVAGVTVPYSAEELSLMSEATASAINENLDKCPKWLLDLLRGGGSVAFAKLAMVLFQVHAQKFQAIRIAMAQAQEREQPGAVN